MLRLAPQPGLLPVQVELVLGDGGLPDALGQAGGGSVPHVHVDRTWVERSPRHAHLVGRELISYRFLIVQINFLNNVENFVYLVRILQGKWFEINCT